MKTPQAIRTLAVICGPVLMLIAIGAALFMNRQSGKYQALSSAEVRHQMGTAELQKAPTETWLRLKDIQKRLDETARDKPLSSGEWSFVKKCIADPNTSVRSAAVFDVFCISRNNPSAEEAKSVMRSIAGETGNKAERQEQKGDALIYLKKMGDPKWKDLVATVKNERESTPDLVKLCDTVSNVIKFNSAH